MSTINVDIVDPQSGNTVTVNGIVTKKEVNKPLILWAGASQTSIGSACTIVGEEAMIANTGNSNTAIGALTLRSNTTATNNTAVGHNSSVHNTTGVNNTSIGYSSLLGQSGLTTGSGNTAIGMQVLNQITTGSTNTGLGTSAGFSITTGTTNTCLGAQAAVLLTTGSNNIAIGHDSQVATPTTSNSITLGNGSNTILRCAVTSITSLSDARDKTNIEESTYGLELVKSLKPVTFEWDTRDGVKKGVKDLGFIAQDLKELDNEHLGLVYSENPEKLEASYGRLIPVLAQAIKDLAAKVEQLENK
jgi:trimeric autotransporter adhesin